MKDCFSEIRVNIWLSMAETVKKLSISDESINRRAIPYQADTVPFKIRYKILKMDEDTEEGRRFLESDAEAFLFDKAALEQPGRRKLFVRKI